MHAPETLLELLRIRAEQAPERRAFVFLHDDGREQGLSNGELFTRARAVAATLQAEQSAGSRALLLYPPGLDFIIGLFGCILAGVVAVPAYPPDPARIERTLGRLRAIANDADVSSILTTSLVHGFAQALASQAPELAKHRLLATDEVSPGAAEHWQKTEVSPGDVALLQYTSGSTAEPRGVMVSHQNVLHNSSAIHELAQHDEGSVYVCWLPTYHDMGLIGGVLQPLYGGFLGVLMSPASFLQNPVRWLRALTRFRGSTTPFPNFALEHCVRRVGPREREELELSALRVACNGAEPVRRESLARFAQAFAPCGFRPEAHYPAYGLAEATLLVSGRRPGESLGAVRVARGPLAVGRIEQCEPLASSDEGDASSSAVDAVALVGCGRSLPDQELLVVDPETHEPVGGDRVGEIWLRGPSVAQGYFRRPEETANTFGARLADGAGPYLRTGDLGFLRDGELYVTGRRKDLIILRGRNLYPQDVERTAERCHRQLRPGCVAAFATEGEGEERLGLVAEVDARTGAPDLEGIWAALQETIAREHDAALFVAALLPAGALPKTSSGKLQRRATREALRRGELQALRTFSATAPLAAAPVGSPVPSPLLSADCASLYDGLHARTAQLDRRSTRYQYDLERDIPWDRVGDSGVHAGPALLASERIDLTSLENPDARELLQWTLAVNICDRFIALEEAVLHFTEQERAALGETRSVELLEAEERKHIVMFRRYGEHLRRLRPELAGDADRYLAACRQRLAETEQRFTNPLERHYANWVQLVFFEEYSLFIYRELLRDAPKVHPVWLAIHRAHAREEAQHIQTDAAYLAALRLTEEQRYTWSRRLFDALAADFLLLFALLGEHARALCERAYPELRFRQLVQNGASATLQVLLADKAFAETRTAAPYFAYVASGQDRTRALVPSEEAAGIRTWIANWLATDLSMSAGEIDARRSFQSYGLDSVRLIALTGDLATFSGRQIAATAAYAFPTTELLAEHALSAPGLVTVAPLSRPGPLPLSARQERLVALERAHPQQVIDHLTEVFTLASVPERAVRTALERLIERHEALRCRIVAAGDASAQFAEPSLAPFPLQVLDGSALDDVAFDAEVRKLALAQDRVPFELTKPLLRATLLVGSGDKAALILSLHHLIADGWSMAIIRRDLAGFVQGALGRSVPEFPALRRQQADVAARERAFLESDQARASLRFWSARIGDHPRLRAGLSGTAFRGSVERLALPKESMDRLAEAARGFGVTPYIAFLTAFCRVLQRRNGEDDVLVNTHLFNRADEDERALVGYLVNVLTIRAELAHELPFAQAVRRVQVAWMEALEHAVPIDEVVRALRPDAYAERYMPSASAFNMLPTIPEGRGIADARVHPRPDLAPSPGFMFFERMLLVAPDPSGNQWLTLWFNEVQVSRSEARELLDELLSELERVSAKVPSPPTAVPSQARREVVWETAKRFFSERLDVASAAVTKEAPLTQLGLDSVLAAELAGALEDALGIPVDASVLFRHRTLDGIARALSVAPARAGRVPSVEPGPLSCSELGLFQLFTRDPGPQAPYNLLLNLRIEAPPDASRLREALALLSGRHEALRTGFYVSKDGAPRRRVVEQIEAPLAVVRVAPSELAAARRVHGDALRARRFDLAHPPLFAAVLLDAESEGVLLFSFSHLIVDAWGLSILQRDLAAIWRALSRGEPPSLAPVPLSASEHGSALHQELAPILERGRAAYPPWAESAYRLPLDAPLPVAPRREGTILAKRVEAARWAGVRAAAASIGVPATAALVAAFQYALHRHARRRDVAFTIIRSGRSSRALRDVVAYLSYGDTVEGRILPGEPWATLLERAGRVVLEESMERMPYNLLLQPPSMRVVLNIHNFTSAVGDTSPFVYEHENRHPSIWPVWDLFFQLLSVGDALLVEVLYRDEVLRAETIERLWADFDHALRELATPSKVIELD